ncbi:hypothetical protein Nepgr_025984 [Nepenthes gracilis]|uniref:Neutral ceramidase n=1 Tax=Nepenthes gracilis TaxID=150966 RepID=A0AAD3T8Z9_NEPGR|nr:hypothetical protein Nepgr_025984 [Nepenthes gracilis]
MDVYEVVKFSQLERQGSPYPVGSFNWFATPRPFLHRAKSLTSRGNKGAVLLLTLVRDVLTTTGMEQIDCQGRKPILLDPGGRKDSVLPIQVLRIRQLAVLNVPANCTTMAGSRQREAESQAFRQPGASSGGSWKPDALGVNYSNLKLFANVDVVKEAAEATMKERELIHAPEGNKRFQQRRGCAAWHRVTLRLLTSWFDIPWVKMEAIETMIAPTLGTLFPVIGASGFAAAAGTVASSVAISASFGAAGAELFEFQIDIKRVIEGLNRAVMAIKKGEVGFLTIAPEYAFCSSGFHYELAVGPPNSTVYYETKQFEAYSTLLHVKSSIATTNKVEFHRVYRVARLNLSTLLDHLSDVGCDTKPTMTTRNLTLMSYANYKRNECLGVLTADSVDFGLGNETDPFVDSIPQINGWSLNVQQVVLYVLQETQWASGHASADDGARQFHNGATLSDFSLDQP